MNLLSEEGGRRRSFLKFPPIMRIMMGIMIETFLKIPAIQGLKKNMSHTYVVKKQWTTLMNMKIKIKT